MIDVDVYNFQSIEHASIRVEGFTALVGRSNIGKSALVRAIKAALTGAGGTSFVRHSASCSRRLKSAKTCDCFTVVHIRTEGFDLKWEKGDKVNRYTFNGEVNDRTGQGTPDFLLKPKLDLDFNEVAIGRENRVIQIADQFDNVFLLNQSGTVVADVLSDVARLDSINVAMGMVEKDRKSASATRKIRDKDVLELTARLRAFDNLDADAGQVDVVAKKLNEISALQTKQKTICRLLQELSVLGSRMKELELACNIPVPDASLVSKKDGVYKTLVRLVLETADRAKAVKRLQGVEDIPEPNSSAVTEASSRFSSLVSWASQLKTFQEYFNHVKGLEQVAVPDPQLLRLAKEQLDTLSVLVRRHDTLVQSINGLELSYDQAVQEEEVLVEEAGVFGNICPTCMQPAIKTHSHERTLD